MRWRLSLCALAAAVSFAACGVAHIRGLREAEDSFNRAAEAENLQRLGDDGAFRGLSEAAPGYRLAAQMSDELIRRNSGELRADNLLCTTYVVRALSLWRLGDHLAAARAADEGKSCAEGAAADAVPRELALLEAVAGLTRIDEANALVRNDKHDRGEFDTIKTETHLALTALQAAADRVPEDHPVRSYFLASRLAAIRVWHAGVTSESLPMGSDPASAGNKELKESRGAAIAALNEYRRFLKCQAKRDDDPGVSFWKTLFAIEDPDLAPVMCT